MEANELENKQPEAENTVLKRARTDDYAVNDALSLLTRVPVRYGQCPENLSSSEEDAMQRLVFLGIVEILEAGTFLVSAENEDRKMKYTACYYGAKGYRRFLDMLSKELGIALVDDNGNTRLKQFTCESVQWRITDLGMVIRDNMKNSIQKIRDFLASEIYVQLDEATKQIDYFACIPDAEGDYALKDVGKGLLHELTFVESIKKNSLSAKQQELYAERFITIIDAARTVLSMEFGPRFTSKNARALERRIMRMEPDESRTFEGEGSRKLYPIDILIPYFIKDRKVELDPLQIAVALQTAGKTKKQLSLTKA